MELARLEEERVAEQAANKLEPHQQRVVEEKKELDDRLAKLKAFLADKPAFLIDAERFRLIRQRELMEDLSQVLGERIAAFDPKVAQKEALAKLSDDDQDDVEYD